MELPLDPNLNRPPRGWRKDKNPTTNSQPKPAKWTQSDWGVIFIECNKLRRHQQVTR